MADTEGDDIANHNNRVSTPLQRLAFTKQLSDKKETKCADIRRYLAKQKASLSSELPLVGLDLSTLAKQTWITPTTNSKTNTILILSVIHWHSRAQIPDEQSI